MIDEYRALILVALMDKNWTEMARRASAMSYLFEDADDESLIFALSRQSHALFELKHYSETLSTLNQLIERFGSSDAPALQEQVAMALFNLACIHALERNVSEVIAALTQWRDQKGDFDCDEITQDNDFDGIRSDPEFIAFLDQNGCPEASRN